DPKQSIYGFRSADIGAYEAVKSLLSREGVTVEPLTTNFRSCRNLISFSNRLAQRLFRHPRPQDSQPAREYCAGRSIRDCVHLVEIHSDSAAEQHLRILAEANWLAARVNSLVWDPVNPRKPQHIGILLRKLTSAHLYVDALNAQNIRVVIEGERFFYQSQEVIDFVNLLKCVVDDMDDVALAGVLRSPLFGLTDQQLAAFFLEYRLHGSASRALKELFSEDESDRRNTLVTFLSVIEDLRLRMREWTPGGLLREVFARLPVLTVAGLAYGNARRELAPLNLLKIHKLALEADPRPEMSAYRFVRTLESYSKEAKQTGQEPMADEALPAVRIMSIHLSKGLDFPVVFVPLTDYGVGASEDAAIVKYDWKTDIAGMKINRFTEANYLRLKYGGGESRETVVRDDLLLAQIEEEERRVLYVAATRAKEQIFFSYVPWTGKKDTGAGRPLLALLSETLPFEIPEEERVTMEVSEPWLAVPAGVQEGSVPLAPVLESWKRIDLATRRRTRLQHLSASEEARPEEEERVERKIPQTANPQAQCIGLICHGVLQRIDFSRTAEFGELVAVKKAELINVFRELDVEAAASESLEILREFFQSEAAQWLSGVEILGREVPVVLPNPAEGSIVSGKADLLIRDGRTLYVIDYKTGRSIEAGALETYRRQMDLYARAIEPIASGMPVRKRLCLLRTGTFLDL
ncbi:MAG TPA: 3'-5' exonuclease, partial [Acidobacteriota bacterium]|nr:3'-5' exonuclease [Acidobacteriota bacterium]